MKIYKLIAAPNKLMSNILLFSIAFIFIFLAPVFPETWASNINLILFSIMFFLGVYALESVRKAMLVIAIVAFITQWIARIFDLVVLEYISDLTNILFFQVVIIKLIIQIAKSTEVSTNVIFESINGYLMMGLLFSTWVALLLNYAPGAFNGLNDTSTFQDIIYFTFVTLTTLGYGEITPQIPLAKSLAIAISTSGQLYVAIIIAMLVGKFASIQK